MTLRRRFCADVDLGERFYATLLSLWIFNSIINQHAEIMAIGNPPPLIIRARAFYFNAYS